MPPAVARHDNRRMGYDLAITRATAITADAAFPATVAVSEGRIAALLDPRAQVDAERFIEAPGCYVLPGGVDAHAHLSLHTGIGLSADDWRVGTGAAALGGTTTMVDFVEPTPGQPLLEALAARLEEASPAVIDYGFHLSVLPDLDPGPTGAMRRLSDARLRELRGARGAGLATFKLYLAYAGNMLTDGDFVRVLAEAAALDALVCAHVENGDVIETLRQQAALDLGWARQREGRPIADLGAAILHALTRPPESERESVVRAISAAELTGARMLIFHLGAAAPTRALGEARARGVDHVYGETCAHYLTLTDDALRREDGRFWMCSPPLRSQADQDALWQQLRAGIIDVISSDHCPFSRALKDAGRQDFRRGANGIPGIEPRLSLIHHFGVRSGRLTLSDWVRLCCTRPATLHGLPGKGTLTPGADADLVVFDPQLRKTLEADSLHSAVDWSPYTGITLEGWPRHVISRGELIVRDQTLLARDGRGRFLRR